MVDAPAFYTVPSATSRTLVTRKDSWPARMPQCLFPWLLRSKAHTQQVQAHTAGRWPLGGTSLMDGGDSNTMRAQRTRQSDFTRRSAGFQSTHPIWYRSKVNSVEAKSPDERSLNHREARLPGPQVCYREASYAGNKFSTRLRDNRRVALRAVEGGHGVARASRVGAMMFRVVTSRRAPRIRPQGVSPTCCLLSEYDSRHRYPFN
ncbi:hypothetical protein LX32DRAFT_367978 [Colletotrichum zoysiae]|uniref:Uncharacterized protein n=1 Tax=Colletotrichum zoysiae TaxID=1216348 RepID=A0AAD9HT56_9PEZI|nr:hypothetical protein LX32DRAFT_367978 [Colletotrichum zoysiae]